MLAAMSSGLLGCSATRQMVAEPSTRALRVARQAASSTFLGRCSAPLRARSAHSPAEACISACGSKGGTASGEGFISVLRLARRGEGRGVGACA